MNSFNLPNNSRKIGFYYFYFINEEPYPRLVFTQVLNVSFVCVWHCFQRFFKLWGMENYIYMASGIHG